MPKHQRYQDYVIKDGRLVGEFEEMYRDFADPWEQTREAFAEEKAIALRAIRALAPRTVVELGSGLGHFTKRIKAEGVPNVIGVDISTTALEKARAHAPECTFVAADILDFSMYERFQPDVIVMAEITWYVLDKLDRFLAHLRETRPDTYLIHLLTTYAEGEQRYGSQYFTNLAGILAYFKMNYVQHGETASHGSTQRTYFVGRYAPLGTTRR